jgi:hypothetical protein
VTGYQGEHSFHGPKSSISEFKSHLTEDSQRWEKPANLVGAFGMMLDPFIDIDPLAILKPLRDLVSKLGERDLRFEFQAVVVVVNQDRPP